MVVYEQLQADCTKLKAIADEEKLESTISQIVKDQLGLEKCLEKLREIIKKYYYTMQLAMAVADADMKFYQKMEQGVENLVRNVKILLKR